MVVVLLFGSAFLSIRRVLRAKYLLVDSFELVVSIDLLVYGVSSVTGYIEGVLHLRVRSELLVVVF